MWFKSDNWNVNLDNVDFFFPKGSGLWIVGLKSDQQIKNAWSGLEDAIAKLPEMAKVGDYYLNTKNISLVDDSANPDNTVQVTFTDGQRLRLPKADLQPLLARVGTR